MFEGTRGKRYSPQGNDVFANAMSGDFIFFCFLNNPRVGVMLEQLLQKTQNTSDNLCRQDLQQMSQKQSVEL